MSQDHGIGPLLDLVAMLRDPSGGCPWDKEQTLASTVPHTIEEAYEVADAIEKNDMTLLKEELGDLLLQIVFYAQIATEHCFFSFSDITKSLTEKLVRRHPHVFGNIHVKSANEQLVVWSALKKEEKRQKKHKQPSSAMDDISSALPPLNRSKKLSALSESVETCSISERSKQIKIQVKKLQSAVAAAAPPQGLVEGLGDLLFTCVRLAYQLRIDPESALRKANDKFERLFRHLEGKNEIMEAERTRSEENPAIPGCPEGEV